MIDIVTLIVVIIIGIALVITNIYLLAYYCHPDDKGNCIGYVLKVIVVLGLTLSWIQVLLLPLDVSNVRTFGLGFDIQIVWYILYGATIAYILIIFPLSSTFYEADEEWSFCEKFKHSLCCFFITLILFAGITAVLFFTVAKTEIPVTSLRCNINNTNIVLDSDEELPPLNNTSVDPLIKECSRNDNDILELDVNIITYCIGVLCFVSWFIFAFFGGIGLAAVPLDFFHDFCTRPKSIKSSAIRERKEMLIKNIEELKELGEEVKGLIDSCADRDIMFSKSRRNFNRKYNEFVAGFCLATDEFHIVNAANEIRVKNNCVIVFYYLLIPLGILTLILSLVWVAQFVCSYVYTLDGRAGYPLLSYLFIFFEDHNIGFLTTVLFSILTIYLLFCVIKGNFKFGVRFLCCFSVHPMKKDGTYMNSFLFNVSLVLLGSCAITQFVAEAFTDYFSFTDVDIIFNVQIKYLKYFRYVYQYHAFPYAFMGFFLISLIFLLLRPSDRITPKVSIDEYSNKVKLISH